MYDFTYEVPKNFEKRIVQYLYEKEMHDVIKLFQNCELEIKVKNYSYYDPVLKNLKGDNWHKKAVDVLFEGPKNDIDVLRSAEVGLKAAISMALDSNESGLLISEIHYFDSNAPLETTKDPISNEERLNCDIKTAEIVLKDLIEIGSYLCSNNTYNNLSTENSINDYFSNMLSSKGYNEVKDQTRHGISKNGKDAGEVDILLTKKGKEIALFEGLKLNSVNTSYINEHIDKSIVNYNSLGTPTFLVAYVSCANFEDFWEKYSKHIQDYQFPLLVKSQLEIMTDSNAATRCAKIILSRDGYDFPVYFIAFRLLNN